MMVKIQQSTDKLSGLLLIALLIVFINSFDSFAQTTSVKSQIIEKWKGESYYMHFVKEGETVQSLAKLYNVSNVSILKANPEIATGLQPGKVIRIPVSNESQGDGKDGLNNTQQISNSTKPGSAYRMAGTGFQQNLPDTSLYQGIHEVMPKETWYGIARQYNVPVKHLIEANPGVDTLKIGNTVFIPKIVKDYRVVTSGYAEHTVQAKETLYGLAKRYNTTGQELIRLNPSLKDGLKAGQVIMVPASSENNGLKIQVTDTAYVIHEVQRKETLYGISKLYGTDINAIVKANPDFDGNLRKGDKLRIPKVVMEMKAGVIPDTVILGRPINKEAITDYKKVPCEILHDSRREFNIALLVPLQLEMVDSISVSDPEALKSATEYASFDFIQFYEGAVIAADSLSKTGMNIRLHVFDVDYGNAVTKTRRVLTQPQLKSMDLIIGPFFAESFNLAAGFALENEIPIVNPLSRRAEVINGNPFVFKVQPSGWSQYNSLANYLKTAHSEDNIIIVRRNQDENKSMAETIKNSVESGNSHDIHVKEVLYNAKGWSGIKEALHSSKSNFVVLLTNDRAALPAILRDLAEANKTQNISIMGLPEWEGFELDYNYLTELNTHFFKPWFVDYNSKEAQNFVKTFRERYIAEPEIEKYAFLGYDITLYFLSSLYNFGDRFTNCIEKYNNPGLSNDLHFIRNPNGGFENSASSVYKYTDFTRVKLN